MSNVSVHIIAAAGDWLKNRIEVIDPQKDPNGGLCRYVGAFNDRKLYEHLIQMDANITLDDACRLRRRFYGVLDTPKSIANRSRPDRINALAELVHELCASLGSSDLADRAKALIRKDEETTA